MPELPDATGLVQAHAPMRVLDAVGPLLHRVTCLQTRRKRVAYLAADDTRIIVNADVVQWLTLDGRLSPRVVPTHCRDQHHSRAVRAALDDRVTRARLRLRYFQRQYERVLSPSVLLTAKYFECAV